MKKMKMLLSMCLLITTMLLYGMDAEAAQELTLNTPVQVSTSEGSYQFTLERQGKVVLSALPTEGATLGYGRFTLYEIDEDENEISVVSAGSLSYSWSSIDTTPVRLPSGVYIVKYEYDNYPNDSPQYAELTIQYTEENPEEYESEKNNNWSMANAIELNKEYKANLQSKDDVDTYRFDLPQEGSLYLNLRNIETVERRWNVALYVEDEDSNKNMIASWENTTNKNSRFTRYRLPKGRYYIKVSSGVRFTTNDYSIGTTYVPETSADSEVEYNNTPDTANVINTNTEYRANIPTTSDVDYYMFTLEKASGIELQLSQEMDSITAGLYNVTLYRKNGDGALLMYDRFNSIANKVSKGHEVTVPEGTYIVLVKNNNGIAEDKNDYLLKINQREIEGEITVPDVPQDVEGEAGIPLSVNCTTLVSTEEGRYLFNISKAGTVILKASPAGGATSGYGRFTLYEIDEDENEISVVSAGSLSYSWSSINTTPVRLPSGTYIVKYEYDNYPNNSPQYADFTIQYDEFPDLSEAEIAPVSPQTYTGAALLPKLAVTYKGKSLEEKKDYTVTYSNNTCAGTAIATINPVENVSLGTKSVTFMIQKRVIPVPVVQQSEFVFDSTEKQVLLSSADTEYLITENDRQINAGVYMAKYTIDENNCVWEDGQTGGIQIPWSIKKANVTISVGTITYTRTIKDGAFYLSGIGTNSDGRIVYAVTQGTDVVSVDAAGQVTPLKAGTAVVSVMAPETENCHASVTKTINILIEDKGTPLSNGNNDSQMISKVTGTKAKITNATNKKGKKIALKLKGMSGGIGYQIQYGIKSSFKGAKTVNKSSNSVTLKKLKKGKKYYIRVRVYKKIGTETYYGKWSGKKSVKIRK